MANGKFSKPRTPVDVENTTSHEFNLFDSFSEPIPEDLPETNSEDAAIEQAFLDVTEPEEDEIFAQKTD